MKSGLVIKQQLKIGKGGGGQRSRRLKRVRSV